MNSNKTISERAEIKRKALMDCLEFLEEHKGEGFDKYYLLKNVARDRVCLGSLMSSLNRWRVMGLVTRNADNEYKSTRGASK